MVIMLMKLENSLQFVNLGTNRTAKQIVAGSAHVCALLDNEEVVCWGDNHTIN